jgi:CBS domain-containing protein
VLIKDIYHKHPKTISSETTVVEAVELLIKERVNGLVVVDKDGRVKGIVSLQDIAAATIPRQFKQNIKMAAAMYKVGFFTEMCQQIKNKPVTAVMRKEFVSVTVKDNIMAVTADFLKNDLYIVPVIEEKKLIGIVTRSEIKKAIAYGMRDIK